MQYTRPHIVTIPFRRILFKTKTNVNLEILKDYTLITAFTHKNNKEFREESQNRSERSRLSDV